MLASLGELETKSAETEFVEGANKLDLTLRDTLRISGILAGPDGQPRRGVKVEAVSADGAVAKFSVSDAKGRFILRRLPDGEFKLRAAGVIQATTCASVMCSGAPGGCTRCTPTKLATAAVAPAGAQTPRGREAAGILTASGDEV